MLSQAPNHRRGFTLIELMVVMALILLIAGLGVAFLPTIGDTARQAQGASMLQQWLLTAKQKAVRDQVPTGLRLIPFHYQDATQSANFASLARDCQYIQQPDDFPAKAFDPTSNIGFLSITLATSNKPATATISNLTVTKSQVAPGDYLEILGNGLMHRITGVIPGSSTTFTLATSPPFAVKSILQYRIARAPRVTGDDVLQLPDPVKIDLQTNKDYSNTLSAGGLTLPARNADGSIDILFAPSGAVISPGVTTETINLWVRDCDLVPSPFPVETPPAADILNGNQSIVAIYVHSGLIAVHPPGGTTTVKNKVIADPYKFIMDGRTSGK